MEPILRYRGLDAFYRAEPRRREPGGIDFGVMWHDGVSSTKYWRLTWIEPTGEVYVHELAGDGMVAVLAEHVRRPAAEWVLGGWDHEHSLMWAWRAVTFPWVAEGFSGYVSQPERRAVWVVRDGWWERPLTVTNSSRRTNSAVVRSGDAVGDPHLLADSLLADYFGTPGDLASANGFTLDAATGWPDLEDFAISSGDIADWLDSVGIDGPVEPPAIQRVGAGSANWTRPPTLEPLDHRVGRLTRCPHQRQRW